MLKEHRCLSTGIKTRPHAGPGYAHTTAGRLLAMWIFLLAACAPVGCSPARAGSEKGEGRVMQDRMDDRAYAGRISLSVARISERKVVDASFNGVEIRPVNQDPLHPEYSNDQLWAKKLTTITNEFGKEGKNRILATQDFAGRRAVLYKFNAADQVAPETLVNFDIWTEVSSKTLEISISAGYGERSTIEQQAHRVLDALTSPNGTIDGGILVVPNAFLHLPPDLGESVNAFFRFGASYELTLKTDVLRHAQPGKDVAELVQAPVPEDFSRRVLEMGDVNAGPLRGKEAVVALHSRKDESDSFVAVYHFSGVEGGTTTPDRGPGA